MNYRILIKRYWD